MYTYTFNATNFTFVLCNHVFLSFRYEQLLTSTEKSRGHPQTTLPLAPEEEDHSLTNSLDQWATTDKSEDTTVTILEDVKTPAIHSDTRTGSITFQW